MYFSFNTDLNQSNISNSTGKLEKDNSSFDSNIIENPEYQRQSNRQFLYKTSNEINENLNDKSFFTKEDFIMTNQINSDNNLFNGRVYNLKHIRTARCKRHLVEDDCFRDSIKLLKDVNNYINADDEMIEKAKIKFTIEKKRLEQEYSHKKIQVEELFSGDQNNSVISDNSEIEQQKVQFQTYETDNQNYITENQSNKAMIVTDKLEPKSIENTNDKRKTVSVEEIQSNQNTVAEQNPITNDEEDQMEDVSEYSSEAATDHAIVKNLQPNEEMPIKVDHRQSSIRMAKNSQVNLIKSNRIFKHKFKRMGKELSYPNAKTKLASILRGIGSSICSHLKQDQAEVLNSQIYLHKEDKIEDYQTTVKELMESHADKLGIEPPNKQGDVEEAVDAEENNAELFHLLQQLNRNFIKTSIYSEVTFGFIDYNFTSFWSEYKNLSNGDYYQNLVMRHQKEGNLGKQLNLVQLKLALWNQLDSDDNVLLKRNDQKWYDQQYRLIKLSGSQKKLYEKMLLTIGGGFNYLLNNFDTQRIFEIPLILKNEEKTQFRLEYAYSKMNYEIPIEDQFMNIFGLKLNMNEEIQNMLKINIHFIKDNDVQESNKKASDLVVENTLKAQYAVAMIQLKYQVHKNIQKELDSFFDTQNNAVQYYKQLDKNIKDKFKSQKIQYEFQNLVANFIQSQSQDPINPMENVRKRSSFKQKVKPFRTNILDKDNFALKFEAEQALLFYEFIADDKLSSQPELIVDQFTENFEEFDESRLKLIRDSNFLLQYDGGCEMINLQNVQSRPYQASCIFWAQFQKLRNNKQEAFKIMNQFINQILNIDNDKMLQTIGAEKINTMFQLQAKTSLKVSCQKQTCTPEDKCDCLEFGQGGCIKNNNCKYNNFCNTMHVLNQINSFIRKKLTWKLFFNRIKSDICQFQILSQVLARSGFRKYCVYCIRGLEIIISNDHIKDKFVKIKCMRLLGLIYQNLGSFNIAQIILTHSLELSKPFTDLRHYSLANLTNLIQSLYTFTFSYYKKLEGNPVGDAADTANSLFNYFNENAPKLRNQQSELCFNWYLGQLENFSQLINMLASNYSRYEPQVFLQCKLVNEQISEDKSDLSKEEQYQGGEQNHMGESLIDKIQPKHDRKIVKVQVLLTLAKMMLNFREVINEAYGDYIGLPIKMICSKFMKHQALVNEPIDAINYMYFKINKRQKWMSAQLFLKNTVVSNNKPISLLQQEQLKMQTVFLTKLDQHSIEKYNRNSLQKPTVYKIQHSRVDFFNYKAINQDKAIKKHLQSELKEEQNDSKINEKIENQAEYDSQTGNININNKSYASSKDSSKDKYSFIGKGKNSKTNQFRDELTKGFKESWKERYRTHFLDMSSYNHILPVFEVQEYLINIILLGDMTGNNSNQTQQQPYQTNDIISKTYLMAAIQQCIFIMNFKLNPHNKKLQLCKAMQHYEHQLKLRIKSETELKELTGSYMNSLEQFYTHLEEQEINQKMQRQIYDLEIAELKKKHCNQSIEAEKDEEQIKKCKSQLYSKKQTKLRKSMTNKNEFIFDPQPEIDILKNIQKQDENQVISKSNNQFNIWMSCQELIDDDILNN